MADTFDIPANILAGSTAILAAVSGAVVYLWKGKQKEVDEARAEIRSLQTKYEDLLRSMIASEPQRKEALDSIARALADSTALLRENMRARP